MECVALGNDILSSDMLVGGLVRSMYNAFQFKDYMEGCWDMYDLNEFLKGFGGYETIVEVANDKTENKTKSAKMAIDDMPPPDAEPASVRDRKNPEAYFLNYRRMY